MSKQFEKIKISLLAIMSVFLLSACSLFNNEPSDDDQVDETPVEEVENDDETEEETISQALTDWFPRLNNVRYGYEGSGNEFAPFTWQPQFNEEDYYQITRDNGGTVMVEIYQYTDDEIIRIHSQEEVYYRDDLVSIWGLDHFQENEVILKTPIALETSWTNGDTEYEITAINKEIEVPAGDYETIEVTATTANSTIKRYYAKDVGLVYEKTETEGLMIESQLATIETDTAEKLPLTIYQADDQLLGLDKIDAELVLETNDPARIALETLLHGETEAGDDIFLLPDGTKINYLFLNEDNQVEADLSSHYIDNMNVGAGGEQFYLQGLVNTLTAYYGVSDLLLTIDGDPYESGHIIIPEGETISFDESMVND